MKTENLVVGGVLVAAVGAVGLYVHGQLKGKRAFEAAGKLPHRYSPQSGMQMGRLARRSGPVGGGDSGITNVGQLDSGGVGWHAGGYNAHLNPSPWSYLTARNENYTYAHTPTNRLLKPVGIANRRVKLQGATGLTRYQPGTTYTYW